MPQAGFAVANDEKRPQNLAAGLVLLDAAFKELAHTADARTIFGSQDGPRDAGMPVDSLLPDRIRERLRNHDFASKENLEIEVILGNRQYLCRAFRMTVTTEIPSSYPVIALVFDRGWSELDLLDHVTKQFNLTEREREAVELLLKGLSGKEVATAMHISPNTVKAFLRLVMIKMGVSNRSGIIAKVLSIRQ